MEEWRAVIVDSVVLSLIQGNEISTGEFVKDDENNGVFLTKKGMKLFIDKYERKMRTDVRYINNQSMSIRRCLWYQVNELVKAVENEEVSLYNPIMIR